MPEDTAAASQVANERHPFRAGSFITGLLALLVAGLFLIDDAGLTDVDGGVAAAVLLLIAGAALIVKTVSRLMGRTGSG
jgi:hypothetical protein